MQLHVLRADGANIQQPISVNTRVGYVKELEMPMSDRNNPLWSTQSLKINTIEKNGCLHDDKVSAMFTVSKV